jgi:hypothetical protein
MHVSKLFALSAVVALTGCLAPADDDTAIVDDVPAVVRLDDPSPWFGVFEYGAGWSTDQLTACWDASAFGTTSDEEATFSEARAWVDAAIQRTWGRLGRVRFNTGFSCATIGADADIRIGHSDDVAGASAFGAQANAITSGPTMLINLRGPSDLGCLPDGDPTMPPGNGGVIARCNGTLLNGAPPSRQVWTEAVAMHVFGLALGLRHEEIHPDASGCTTTAIETLDGNGHDGEALWSYDPSSIMQSCHLQAVAFDTVTPTLSLGDLRALDSLYPAQVRVFTQAQLGGTATSFGPGAYVRADSSALWNVQSMIVPPGVRVHACSSAQCWTYSGSQLALPITLATHIVTFDVWSYAVVADLPGFRGAAQWLSAGVYTGGQLTVGDNRISSAWIAPTLSITLCDGATGTAPCTSAAGGTVGTPWLAKIWSLFGASVDNAASYVSVQRRAVTFAAADFRGASYSLAPGVYRSSSGSTWLPGVRSIALPAGLEAVACSSEAVYPRPTCQTFTRSGAVTTGLSIQSLDVHTPPTNAP